MRAPAVQSGLSIRLKLIVALPAIVVFAALGATLLALPPGTRWSTVLQRELVGAGVVLALTMPAALLLARSTLRPLGDLLHATERLGRGDLQTRVRASGNGSDWPLRTRVCSWRSADRGPGSSRRPTANAAASSATSTTAPNSV